MDKILLQIAAELKARPAQIQAAVELLDGGASVPFIARYRKEATDGLDDIQLRELETRLAYLRELEDRREAVLKSIEEQGKLTPGLRALILAAPTKQELEDLYLPYKVKRRTKGLIAREAGLEPLADKLFADPTLDPQAEAAAFLNPDAGFADTYAVLDGVRDLLSERWAEDAVLVGKLREWLWAEGLLQSKLVDGKDGTHADAAKFRDYFDYAEPMRTVPSHRALAVFRGRTQEWLDAKLILEEEVVPGQPTLAEGRIAQHLGWRHGKRAADELIRKTIAWTWKVKLSLSLERDLFARLPESRERGYAPGRFSFNVKGGRCEACQGDGLKRIEMNFLPDVYVSCDVCRTRRYNVETLAVKYKGYSIADLLESTVEQALGILENVPQLQTKLQTLVDVGLGYIHLGQSSTTLSGGEAQRIKLAKELSRRQTGKTLYILDEPTTGLHFEDVKRLLDVINRLVDLGNTVIIIEHNLDVMKCADWIIDLGPEGGEGGGTIVAAGTPEDVVKVKKSYTGKALAKVLAKK